MSRLKWSRSRSRVAPTTKYRYATLIRADGRKEIKPGKQRADTTRTYVIEDGEVQGRLEHRLAVYPLPEPMTADEIVEWAEEHRDDVFDVDGEADGRD